MVSPPRPGVRYTAQQIEAMRQAYPDFVMPGHVMRIDSDGMTSFVPEARSASAFGRGNALQTAYRSKVPIREDFPVDPIQKRTPQQRVDSMVENLLENWRQTGTIPGLSEERVTELVARSWRRGQPLSASDVRAAASALLAEAEAKYEASEHRKVVRTAPSD